MLVAALALLHVLERHDDRIVAPVVGIETACGNELADVAHVVEGVGRQYQQTALEKHLVVLMRTRRPVVGDHVFDAPVVDRVLINQHALDFLTAARGKPRQQQRGEPGACEALFHPATSLRNLL